MKTNSTLFDPVLNYAGDQATALTCARYQRIAPLYDRMEQLMGKRFRPWREKIWQFSYGPRILEVGVGTGKNMEFWPLNSSITAVDLTPGMLEIAKWRAKNLSRQNDGLFLGDVQHLDLPSASFNTIVATFVFCSVPDPIQGLRELGRLIRPDGQILLLEHVRIDKPVIGPVMDFLAPLVVRLNGANINRRTVENVRIAGLQITQVEDLDDMGMFKLIFAQPKS